MRGLVTVRDESKNDTEVFKATTHPRVEHLLLLEFQKLLLVTGSYPLQARPYHCLQEAR